MLIEYASGASLASNPIQIRSGASPASPCPFAPVQPLFSKEMSLETQHRAMGLRAFEKKLMGFLNLKLLIL